MVSIWLNLKTDISGVFQEKDETEDEAVTH